MSFPSLTMPFTKDEFTRTMQKQFDFEWEAYNMTKFAENFASEAAEGKLRFPQVSGDLLSSCVLVEEFAQGRPMSEIFTTLGDKWAVLETDDSKESSEIRRQKEELANIVFDLTLKMFVRDNFVHGDLHAGNLLWYEGPDGSPTLTVLDAGLTNSVEPDMEANFAVFLQAMCSADVEEILKQLLIFNVSETPVDENEFRKSLQTACDRWVDPKTGMDPNGGPISMGDLMGEIFFGLNKFDIFLRGDVASTLITISIAEGLIRQLDPTFDIITRAVPYLAIYHRTALLAVGENRPRWRRRVQ